MDILWLLSGLALGWGGARLRHNGLLFGFWGCGIGLLLSTSLLMIWKNSGWAPPAMAAVSLWALLLVAEIVRRHACEAREKARLKGVFQRCVSPSVAEQILNSHSLEELLAGKTTEATVLFFDIRGFSSAAEKLAAEHLLHSLNRHLEIIVKNVLAHGGMINNFLGDAVLAVFNCPLPLENSRSQALRCFLACRENLGNLATDRPQNIPFDCAQDRPVNFSFGAGLNHGRVVAGGVGSQDRFNYSVIGDEVNLAARLESLTRHYPVDIILSGPVFQGLDEGLAANCLRMDRVTVKGRENPLNLYTLLELSAEDRARHQAALDSYLKGKFKEAAAVWEKLDHPLFRFMAGRCKQFTATPPESWPGYFSWTEK